MNLSLLRFLPNPVEFGMGTLAHGPTARGVSLWRRGVDGTVAIGERRPGAHSQDRSAWPPVLDRVRG
jgi:hypothetical protein